MKFNKGLGLEIGMRLIKLIHKALEGISRKTLDILIATIPYKMHVVIATNGVVLNGRYYAIKYQILIRFQYIQCISALYTKNRLKYLFNKLYNSQMDELFHL